MIPANLQTLQMKRETKRDKVASVKHTHHFERVNDVSFFAPFHGEEKKLVEVVIVSA